MANPDTVQVRDLLAQASELPADQREVFLNRACDGNPGLQREVENLLRVLEQASEFLAPGTADRPPTRLSPPEDPELLPTPEVLGPGTMIGPYKLLQLLGEGGFGRVYLAMQEQPVERQVALKIIKPGMDTRQVIARFKAERQALARMDHPNIARVLDAGSTAAGRPYFVMELVRGVPITEYCSAVRLDLNERLDLFVRVCKAVQHAHQKGIIHRDLKPGNVLVTMTDGKPIPKVIDFGVAKAIDASFNELTTIGDGRHWMGTPQYMSPEQTGSGALDIDTRSDIYSLGVLLYELLTGSTPFDSRELRKASPVELHRIISQTDPPRPSSTLARRAGQSGGHPQWRQTIDPRKLSQIVRGDLDWIVMRCMEKDRTRRYESASALAHDVENYLSGQPVQARPPSQAYQIRKFVRRHKALIGSTAIILAALLLGTFGTAMGLVREHRARAVAVAERDLAAKSETAARNEAARAAAADAFLLNMISSADPQHARGKDLTLRDVLDEASRQIDRSPPADVRTAQAIRHTLGVTYQALGTYGRSVEHLRQSLALCEKIYGATSIQAARSMGDLADALWDDLRYREADPLYRRSLQIRQELLGPANPEVAAAMERVGNMLQGEGDAAGAQRYLQQALELRRRLLGEENLDMAQSLYGLAIFHRDHGRRAPAESMLQEALRIQRKLLGDNNRTVTQTLFALATVAPSEAEAQKRFEQTLGLQERVLGHDHPDVATTMMYLALARMDQGDYSSAPESLLEQAIQINRAVLGPEHGQVAKDLQTLAQLFMCRGQLAASERDFDQALALYRKTIGEGAPELQWVFRDYIPVLLARKEFTKAESLLQHRYQCLLANPSVSPRLARMQVEFQLVDLYSAWDHPKEKERWSTMLHHEFPSAVALPPTLTPATQPVNRDSIP